MTSLINKLATMTVVRVVAVDGRTVDIQPIVAQLDGAGNAIAHGTIHNVPIWRLQSGGMAIIVDPVIGDIGMAVFAHSDISTVKATGDAAPPGSKRRFDWADAVYLGGLFGPEATSSIRLGGGGVEIDAPTFSTTGASTIGGGATGTFASTDGKVVSVVAGIITDISS